MPLVFLYLPCDAFGRLLRTVSFGSQETIGAASNLLNNFIHVVKIMELVAGEILNRIARSSFNSPSRNFIKTSRNWSFLDVL